MPKKAQKEMSLTTQQVALLRGETPEKLWGAHGAKLFLQKRGLLDERGRPTQAGRDLLARWERGEQIASDERAYRALRDVITVGEFARELAEGDEAAYERWRGTLKKACQAASNAGEHWVRKSGDTWLMFAPYARRRWGGKS